MADPVKISELPPLASVQPNDILPVVDSALTQTSRCTAQQISAIGGGPPGDNTVSTVKLQDGAVTYQKIQNVAGDRLLGRNGTTSGVTQEVPCTGFARTLLAAADGDAARALLNDSATFTGTVTVNGALAVNGNASITGTSEVNGLATFRGGLSAPLPSGGVSYPLFGARAFVSFNGFNLAIYSSGNVTSVGRSVHAAGRYRINFATTMPDSNYAILLTARDVSIGGVGADGYPNDTDNNAYPMASMNFDTPKNTAYFEVLSAAALQANAAGLYDTTEYAAIVMR